MRRNRFLLFFAVALVGLTSGGCTRTPFTPNVARTEEPALAVPSGGERAPEAVRSPLAQPQSGDAGTPAPPAVSSYRPYTKDAYEQAKAEGRPILLYFYANWCPLCADQEPKVVELFRRPDIADWGVAAFRVNYNDSDTDSDERDLAAEFGVNYQHTFFTFDRSGKQVWRATGTQSPTQLRSRLEAIR
ncbi:MAG: thioredoxin family protein [bacterium]|nr:thioredoxin family protein [bacterium]